MKIFDLTFSDGRTCRVIDPDPIEDAAESLRSYQAVFKPGYLVGMQRIVAPPPEKLPWKRDGDGWKLGDFRLSKRFDDETQKTRFLLKWPGNEFASHDKDEISEAVHLHWNLCV